MPDLFFPYIYIYDKLSYIYMCVCDGEPNHDGNVDPSIIRLTYSSIRKPKKSENKLCISIPSSMSDFWSRNKSIKKHLSRLKREKDNFSTAQELERIFFSFSLARLQSSTIE